MRSAILFCLKPKSKTLLIHQRLWPLAGFCDDRRNRTDDDGFGPVSDEVILGLPFPADVGHENEEQERFSSRKQFFRGIKDEANQIFQVLLQDGPGFNARGALDDLKLEVCTALVREVLLQILVSINGANKQRWARICYKFFVWAGQRQGYKHTPTIYNLTMKIFAESAELKAMWRLLDEMTQNGLPVTPRTFNILISTSGDAGMTRKVVERFMKSRSFTYRPYKHSFNAILHSLIIMGLYRLIEWVYQKMLLEGQQPDVLTYNIVLCAKFRLGKLDQFHRLLDEMRKKEIPPDLHTYNLMLNVLGKGDKPLAAVDLLNYMAGAGCHPSVLHFTNLIDGLSRAGNLEACKYFFDEMIKKGCEPDVVCYTVLITGYVWGCEFEKAQELFDQMQIRGQIPNVYTYNAMIRGLCFTGKFADACAMLKHMETKGCKPNFCVYSTLVSRLRNAGKVSEANVIINGMVEKGHYLHMLSRFKGYRRC